MVRSLKYFVSIICFISTYVKGKMQVFPIDFGEFSTFFKNNAFLFFLFSSSYGILDEG